MFAVSSPDILPLCCHIVVVVKSGFTSLFSDLIAFPVIVQMMHLLLSHGKFSLMNCYFIPYQKYIWKKNLLHKFSDVLIPAVKYLAHPITFIYLKTHFKMLNINMCGIVLS